MRKLTNGVIGLALAVAIVSPAAAVGLGDLAKVVLGGGSILKKGEAKCGSSLGLTKDDSLALTFARAAAERALPISEFTALDSAANAEADKSATSSTFCNETKKKKSGMMKSIKKAGKSILAKRILGG
jgi:antitoxin component of RelBE/YafQ-DinJ toxin-antitoxin module